VSLIFSLKAFRLLWMSRPSSERIKEWSRLKGLIVSGHNEMVNIRSYFSILRFLVCGFRTWLLFLINVGTYISIAVLMLVLM